MNEIEMEERDAKNKGEKSTESSEIIIFIKFFRETERFFVRVGLCADAFAWYHKSSRFFFHFSLAEAACADNVLCHCWCFR